MDPLSGVLVLGATLFAMAVLVTFTGVYQTRQFVGRAPLGLGGFLQDVIDGIVAVFRPGVNAIGYILTFGRIGNLGDLTWNTITSTPSMEAAAGALLTYLWHNLQDLIRTAVGSLLSLFEGHPVTTTTVDTRPMMDILNQIDANVRTIEQEVGTRGNTTTVVPVPVGGVAVPPISTTVSDPDAGAIQQLQADVKASIDFTQRVENAVWSHFTDEQQWENRQQAEVTQALQQANLDRDLIVSDNQYIATQLVPYIQYLQGQIQNATNAVQALTLQTIAIQRQQALDHTTIGQHAAAISRLWPLIGIAALSATAIQTLINIAERPCMCLDLGGAYDWVPAVLAAKTMASGI